MSPKTEEYFGIKSKEQKSFQMGVYLSIYL
jgi:hypothetical protein